MKVQILGAHALESVGTKFVSILIDGVLALDTGAITHSLSLSEQEKIKAFLLSHSHADHIEGLASLGMHAFITSTTIDVYGLPETITALKTHVFNNVIHPDFSRMPSAAKPSLRYHTITPGKTHNIEGYDVFACPVQHSVPTTGYQVTDKAGRSILYSGDTGPATISCWDNISPDIVILDCAASDRWLKKGPALGHMTPGLLKSGLTEFYHQKGRLPPVILIHMVPDEEEKIKEEVGEIARELNARIELGYEGMEFEL